MMRAITCVFLMLATLRLFASIDVRHENVQLTTFVGLSETTFEIPVFNSSGDPETILEVQSSCPCLEIISHPPKVPPKAAENLIVKLKPKPYAGLSTITLTIITAKNPDGYAVRVSETTKPAISVERLEILWGGQEELTKKSVTFDLLVDVPAVLEEFECDADVSPSLESFNGGRGFRLSVEPRASLRNLHKKRSQLLPTPTLTLKLKLRLSDQRIVTIPVILQVFPASQTPLGIDQKT